MAHFAKLDENNIVVLVVKGRQEDDGKETEISTRTGDTYKQTSYNTKGGVHRKGGTPLRKNYAGVGYTYREDLNGFVAPCKFNTWILNEETCKWEPPVAYPQTQTQNLKDENGNPINDRYYWNDPKNNWEIIE